MSDYGPPLPARQRAWCSICHSAIPTGTPTRARIEQGVLITVHATCLDDLRQRQLAHTPSHDHAALSQFVQGRPPSRMEATSQTDGACSSSPGGREARDG